MSIIRQNIIESATRHFSENGYEATSIQEIADDCGIAKGSLYKFFPSKEDLYIAFHDSQQMAMYTKIEKIRGDATRSLREVFILETECHFEFFLNNKFIMHDIKKMNTSKGHYAPYFLRLRANHLKYSKESLIRFLGEVICPNIWDLVIMYNGIAREFIFLVLYENKPLNSRNIAVYIADRIEELSECIVQKKTKPILQNSLMDNYMQYEIAEKSIPVEEYRTYLLGNLLSTVKELPITNFRKTELNDAIALLQEELTKEAPKSILIHALLDFIGKEHELNNIVSQLKRYIF
ncbi:TetR/AcrR family transcriptional regulator [Psychrobacillus sp. NPDC058041]|uniref:TetR/AcrR family transcriptional regulator n=1 Tax=Psychrobacillus sp. NPDC058041 TaxID=3346310 RepID=UPI0036DD05D2